VYLRGLKEELVAPGHPGPQAKAMLAVGSIFRILHRFCMLCVLLCFCEKKSGDGEVADALC
jgi:hypothetical protein